MHTAPPPAPDRRSGSPRAATIREIVGWTNIRQPGFYVNQTTGQGFRITRELLSQDDGTALHDWGAEQEKFVMISDDPYVRVTAAKAICADCGLSPSF